MYEKRKESRAWTTRSALQILMIVQAVLFSVERGAVGCPVDLDGDSDADLVDFGSLAACVGGPGAAVSPECEGTDSDLNGFVDLRDFARFQRAFTTIPDLQPPEIVVASPRASDLSVPDAIASVSVQFNEPIDPSSVVFELFGPGPDGVLSTSDDQPLKGGFVIDPGGEFAVIALDSPLAAGVYRGSLEAYADLLCNSGRPFEWLFSTRPQQAEYTSNSTIECGDLSREGFDIVVSGATLTVNCAHLFNSITLQDGSSITHSPGQVGRMDLSVEQYVVVEPGSQIGADGRGFGDSTGPGEGGDGNSSGAGGAGGGGHGGAGGDGTNAFGGPTYGSVTEPVDFGSGGGHGGCQPGGAGGGAIRVSVGGAFLIDGAITANGLDGISIPGCAGGGGAGGSVYLTASTLEGTGIVSANGGRGFSDSGVTGGGGAGGRIAVYFDTGTFAGSIAAYGGSGAVRGGAGTVYTEPVGMRGTIRVDNGGGTGATTEFSGHQSLDANLIIIGAGIVGPPKGEPGFHLDLVGDLTLASDGLISANGRGFGDSVGPGEGGDGNSTGAGGAGGAGHGGAGGNGTNALGGPTYGSVTEPLGLGSGGGHGGCRPGGPGGGAVRVSVGGTLQIDGAITANGSDGVSFPGCVGGGGSGGSIYVTTTALTGFGSISASGGRGFNNSLVTAGGGAGGRIAVYYDTNTFLGSTAAYGGSGAVRGGAGTIFTKASGNTLGTITIDNDGIAGATTEFSGEVAFDANLRVRRAAIVGPPVAHQGFHLVIAGDATVEPDGFVSANARGHGESAGLGAGGAVQGGSGGAGGGGHGGSGGNGSQSSGGGTYGLMEEPVELGSGGGHGACRPGGRGGGAIQMTVGGKLEVDGQITANGTDGTSFPGCDGGGGSGGSIYLTASRFAGSGLITANGGRAFSTCCAIGGGGGGGGRVAIYSCEIAFDDADVRALGGTGMQNGSPGTVHFGSFDSLPSGAVGNSGAVIIVPPPPSVELNAFVNDTKIRVFDEILDHRLSADVLVDLQIAGIALPFTVDSFSQPELAASFLSMGSVVNSHLVHFDTTSNSDSDPDLTLSGSVTFDSDILAVILRPEQLNATDALLGNTGATYPPMDNADPAQDRYWRGMELDDSSDDDSLTVGTDGRTLTISMRVREWADQARVITAVSNDCNGNHVVDVCDLRLETSTDSDSNSVPDECD